jgi:hypothetical protein
MRSSGEIDLESGQRRSFGFHVLFFGFGEFALKWTNQYSNDHFVFLPIILMSPPITYWAKNKSNAGRSPYAPATP